MPYSLFRLTEAIYQTAKIAKVLLLLNSGKGSEFNGKNLSDIQIAEDEFLNEEGEEENIEGEENLEEIEEDEENIERDDENIEKYVCTDIINETDHHANIPRKKI